MKTGSVYRQIWPFMGIQPAHLHIEWLLVFDGSHYFEACHCQLMEPWSVKFVLFGYMHYISIKVWWGSVWRLVSFLSYSAVCLPPSSYHRSLLDLWCLYRLRCYAVIESMQRLGLLTFPHKKLTVVHHSVKNLWVISISSWFSPCLLRLHNEMLDLHSGPQIKQNKSVCYDILQRLWLSMVLCYENRSDCLFFILCMRTLSQRRSSSLPMVACGLSS